MADAKKCDVCGKYYDKYYMHIDDKTKFNGIALLNDNFIGHRESLTSLELCPDCMNSINEHLEYLSSVTTVTYGNGEKYHIHPAITCQDNGAEY